MNYKDYFKKLDEIVSDNTKFVKIKKDPTAVRNFKFTFGSLNFKFI